MRWTAAMTFSALVLATASAPSPAAQRNWDALRPTQAANQLSVMTYNVEGLPFPVALNRTDALQKIGLRLAGLRSQGRQPHIVLLQEAFTPEAKEIAALAGYRFVASGPAANGSAAKASAPSPAPVMSASYDADTNWRKGEGVGKWVDSGLMVLSDFPIVATFSMTFADDACAGFDCLAAKGVLLTWIKVPGQAAPLAIADTHMNSRNATGVATERANAAYAEQWKEARRFIQTHVGPTSQVIFGGDFNIGHDPQRLALVRGSGGPLAGAREATAMAEASSRLTPSDQDIQAVITRGKDKQFFRPAPGTRLHLRSLSVPFGISEGGYAMSDHLGYVASYGLS